MSVCNLRELASFYTVCSRIPSDKIRKHKVKTPGEDGKHGLCSVLLLQRACLPADLCVCVVCGKSKCTGGCKFTKLLLLLLNFKRDKREESENVSPPREGCCQEFFFRVVLLEIFPQQHKDTRAVLLNC